MLGMDFFLMQYLIRKAKSYEFMGLSAVIQSDNLEGAAILTSLLRWQNDQGQRMRQEYTAYEITADGQVTVNPQNFSEWMKQSAQTGDVTIDREQNKSWFEAMGMQRINGWLKSATCIYTRKITNGFPAPG